MNQWNIFFFNEVNSFKNQLLETSEIVPIRLQSETDNINTSGISERLSFQDKFSTLKNQSDRKDKVINPLLEKLEKKRIVKKFHPSGATKNGSCVIQTSSAIRVTSVITQHVISTWIIILQLTRHQKHKIMTHDKNKADVPPTSKENMNEWI